MSVKKRVLLILAILLVLGATGFLLLPPQRYAVKLTAYDSLIKPGEKCHLSAKLEHDGPLGVNPDMRGYELAFEGKPFGRRTARTGRDGVATVEIELDAAAGTRFSVDVVFSGSTRHQPAAAAAEVFIWSEKARILVTDIDHTISDFSQLKVPFVDNQNIPILPDADVVLSRLSRDYHIVYLSARDDALYGKTKAWLKLHAFPPGPFFCRDYRIGQSQEAFKTQFLAGFTQRFTHVEVGVGDRPSDAHTYLSVGMQSIMIDPEGKKSFPEGTIVVGSWKEVERRLMK